MFIICSVITAHPADSVRTEKRKGKVFVVHQVDEKETLYSLSKRYKTTVAKIIEFNELEGNSIDFGQVLTIPYGDGIESQPISDKEEMAKSAGKNIHVVAKGETLYSISRQYQLSVEELKSMNNLSDNNLALGMGLVVSSEIPEPSENSKGSPGEVSGQIDTYLNQFEKYLVQTGETLQGISTKLGNSVDSLKRWNDLSSHYLKIGQELLYKPSPKDTTIHSIQPKETGRTEIDGRGFERVFEEGIVAVIEDMDTKKFLALHRKLPIGTNLEVRNLMNNQVVHVKVVGILPKTGLNKNVLVRISQPAYDQLGILDKKARVEVSYAKM